MINPTFSNKIMYMHHLYGVMNLDFIQPASPPQKAVALDPALPLAVRLQLINSRRDLRSKVRVSGSESRLDDSYLWQKNGMDFLLGGKQI